MDDTTSFGYRIKRQRKRLDLTQVELARRVGCAPKTIEKLEADERRPSKAMAERLADALELDPGARPGFLSDARGGQADTLSSTPWPAGPSTIDRQPVRGAIRVSTTPLIGRAGEVAAVCAALTDTPARLVTLTGPGGIGKTRVALQVAADLAARFADGVTFVDLTPIRDPELVLTTIARALGLTEVDEQPVMARLQAALHAQQLLLVLDNFEQILAAAPVIAELLAAAPGLRVLTTSRAVLHIYGEHEFAVPPLALPDPSHLPMAERLSEYSAVALFIQRAQAVRRGFQLTDTNAAVVAEICHRLDGLPLALELAAARTKLFTPEALLQRLERRLEVLRGGPRDVPVRHQALRAAIDWSYHLLTPEEQQLFRRLGVFSGGWTVQAAEAVCRMHVEQPFDMAERLEVLLDNSLIVQQAASNGEPRFTMLETMREYALDRLVLEDEQAVRQAHAAHVLTLIEMAEPELFGPRQLEWLERLEAEHDNLRAALQWTLHCQGNVAHGILGLQLATGMGSFWRKHGHQGEGRRWLEAVLEQTPAHTVSDLLRAKALRSLGGLTFDLGEEERAMAMFEESRALSEQIGDTAGLAEALAALGWLTEKQGNYPRGVELAEQSLALYRELGDTHGIASALNHLTSLTLDQGNAVRAALLSQESESLFRALGDQSGLAWSLRLRGEAAAVQGDSVRAEALFEACAGIFRTLGDTWNLAYALDRAARSARQLGDYRQATVLYEESVALRRDAGDTIGAASALIQLALAVHWQGEFARARTLREEALRVFQDAGHEEGIALALDHLSKGERDTGNPVEARRLAEEALVIFQTLDHQLGIAWTLWDLAVIAIDQADDSHAAMLIEQGLALFRNLEYMDGIAATLRLLGELTLFQGDTEQALGAFRESLRLYHTQGTKIGIVYVLEAVAGVAGQAHKLEQAARLFGAAEALRARTTMPLPPADRPRYERALSVARAHLDDRAWEAAWAEGRGMPLEQAIAYALEETATFP